MRIKKRCIRAEEEVELLKGKIKKHAEEIDQNKNIKKEDNKHIDLLNKLYHKRIIDEDKNFIE